MLASSLLVKEAPPFEATVREGQRAFDGGDSQSTPSRSEQMRRLLLIGSLVALLVPTASHAQFQIGLRLGYAPAMGDAYQAKGDPSVAKMSDGVKSQVPIQIDANYKINKDMAAGLYFSYGFGQVGSTVKDSVSPASVSASAIRVGAQGNYTFSSVASPLVPWAGVFVGYEQAKLSLSSGASGDFTLSGYELGVQVGGDYKVTPQFGVGPFIGLSVGQYTSVSGSGDVQAPSIDTKTHEWFTIGVRGVFDL
jgi:hypothetical protein